MTAARSDHTTASRQTPVTAGEPRAALAAVRRNERSAWTRPAFAIVLAATGCLYLIGLTRSGWANGYYSAAVFAGSKSWSAMLFGSLDPANFISVDKPPAALWPAELLARAFGLNPWTVLLPQAVEGIAAVALLRATVRRQAGDLAGLLAGAVLAVTPVCALMFRFNNPDALLTLLMICAAYFTVRALEDGRTRWVVLVGTVLGLAFLTKLLQALVIAPALLLPYLAATPHGWRRKARDVGFATAAFVCAAGWWMAVIALVPASERPYVGSSQHNSIFELVLGYDGLGRLTGHEAGVSSRSALSLSAGDRLFQNDMGNEISWFLPAAILLSLAGLWWLRSAATKRGTVASWSIWVGWLLIVAVELSCAQGTVHSYYTIALAPAISAIVGIGATHAWNARRSPRARLLLCAVGVATVAWSFTRFSTAAGWNSSMRWVALLGVGTGAAMTLRLAQRRTAVVGAAVLSAGCLVLPAAWSVKTAMVPHRGAQPVAGPAVGTLVLHLPVGGTTTPRSERTEQASNTTGRAQMGGLFQISKPSSAMTTALMKNAGAYTWIAATVGANNAAGIELAARQPVIALGGYNATDPTLSLAEFQRLVSERKVHYFVNDLIDVPKGESDVATRQIPQWVASHFGETEFDTVRIYDLTAPLASNP